MKAGYLGLQMLNGYANTLPEGPLRKLTYAVDLWIEKNTTIISHIVVTPFFYVELCHSLGQSVETVDTLVGEALLIVSPANNIPEIQVF
jgi:hypothetical protein